MPGSPLASRRKLEKTFMNPNIFSKRRWWLLLAAAFIPRLAFLWIWQKESLDSRFYDDGYVLLAQHWLGWVNNLSGFEVHNPAPGFAFWCAMLFKLAGGPNLLVIRMVNVVLSSFSCVLLGLWATHLRDENTGLAAGLLLALSPMHVFFSAHLQSETFFVFFEILFFGAMLRYWPTTLWRVAFPLGFFGGALCLVRSAFAVYLPVLCLVCLWQIVKKQTRIVAVAGLLVGWSLPILGWTYYNWSHYHRFIPLTVQSGLTLYAGISLNAEDRANRIIPVWAEMKQKGIDDWVDQDGYFRNKALDFIKANPVRYAGIVVKKSLQYWRPWPYSPYPKTARVMLGFYYGVLFVLAIMGMIGLRSQAVALLPVFALFAALSVSHSFFDTSLRYRMPLEPYLCVFAAVGWLSLFRRWNR
jgi:4-amino-4-deoxy-L-arabinose transferase-like glycosyltransferase